MDKTTLVLIVLLLLIAFGLTFFVTGSVEAAKDNTTPPWLVDCKNDADIDGFMDRGFCVPGVITKRTHYVRSPSRFYGVGSSYAPGIMEWMCQYNGGCDGFKDGATVMSCGDIGRTAWIKVDDDHSWYGPLKVVDCSQPFHAYVNVAVYGLAVEWGHKTALALGISTASSVRVHLGGKPIDDEWGWYYRTWWINSALDFIPSIGLNWELRFAYAWLCEERGICYR